uniref:5-cytosine rRNA methyltransferase NSUN4 n=1 Tax=Ciona savignyi TaxID=51511 RepID=H2YUK6_CIOSA
MALKQIKLYQLFLPNCGRRTISIGCCKSGGSKQKRYKMFRQRTDAVEIAKEYFDLNYVKHIKEQWPSVRCAMQSRKKYCAILNNFTDTDAYENELVNSGAYNFIAKLHRNATQHIQEIESKVTEITDKLSNMNDADDSMLSEVDTLTEKLSEHQKLQKVCYGVRAYLYEKGDITEFDNPHKVKKLSVLPSFLLDAGSVLPILSLDPQPGDHILDMCSAPGGKLNIIMQAIGDSGRIVANDVDSKRLTRIKNVYKEYIPKQFSVEEFIKFVQFDGREWTEIETNAYDKVLVDVPCTNDRHSLYTSDRDADNIFSNLRKRERAQLPHVQCELLKNAILACRPNGIVVYSTCTASPLQNQFVVQYAVQELLEQHNITCQVEDTRSLVGLLHDEFQFLTSTNLGELVIPKLDANFGPMYFCKLRRLPD